MESSPEEEPEVESLSIKDAPSEKEEEAQIAQPMKIFSIKKVKRIAEVVPSVTKIVAT